jgi:hypothetical protein
VGFNGDFRAFYQQQWGYYVFFNGYSTNNNMDSMEILMRYNGILIEY